MQKVREYAAEEQCEVFVVCAQIEQEIAELDDDEKKIVLWMILDLTESGLEKLIKASYQSAWTDQLPDSRRAGSAVHGRLQKEQKHHRQQVKIHTDFERGFIRAEVVSYDDLMECGSSYSSKRKRTDPPGRKRLRCPGWRHHAVQI